MNTFEPSRKLRALLLAALFGLGTIAGVSGCDTNEGPFEEAGEQVDDAVDETQDAADDAGDEIEDAADDIDDEF